MSSRCSSGAGGIGWGGCHSNLGSTDKAESWEVTPCLHLSYKLKSLKNNEVLQNEIT